MAYRKVNDDSLTAVANSIRQTFDIADKLEFPDGFVDAIQNGMSVNFDVKQYESETVLPSTTKENTIAVITDVAITDYVFMATEPTTGNTDGRVWIQTGMSSIVPFNALRKNEMYILPVAVMQYVDGEWEDVFAYIHQNNEWVQFSEIVTEYYLSTNASDWTMGSTTEEGYLSINMGPWTSVSGMTYPPSKTVTYTSVVDMTDYNTMEVEIDFGGHTFKTVQIFLVDDSDNELTNAQFTEQADKTIYTLNITKFSSGKPRVYLRDGSQYGTAVISMVRLTE